MTCLPQLFFLRAASDASRDIALLLAPIFLSDPQRICTSTNARHCLGARERALGATAKLIIELQIIFLNAQVVDLEK
jgi:hypothetical protein